MKKAPRMRRRAAAASAAPFQSGSDTHSAVKSKRNTGKLARRKDRRTALLAKLSEKKTEEQLKGGLNAISPLQAVLKEIVASEKTLKDAPEHNQVIAEPKKKKQPKALRSHVHDVLPGGGRRGKKLSQKARSKLASAEIAQFNAVLSNEAFRSNPLQAVNAHTQAVVQLDQLLLQRDEAAQRRHERQERFYPFKYSPLHTHAPCI
ncbi:MAG: hypothetical protein MHM6MM_005997 [Cercozoa sp. M6MM]